MSGLKSTVALPMLMPALRVNVVLPLMVTGAEGLLMVIPAHVSAAPRVLVQLAGVVTVESQIAISPLPGAVPPTQLAPDCKALLLFALVWFACALDVTAKMPNTAQNK